MTFFQRPFQRFFSRPLCLGLLFLAAGCAGLQIDVDVYKGPLANSDETQQQQLASMALSAKPLIIEYRNSLLDELKPGWAPLGGGLRGDYIDSSHWRTVEQTGQPDAQARQKMLHARQLNGILSFYKDRCKGGASPEVCIDNSEYGGDSGYDHGRPDSGIETLANALAKKVYDKRSRPGDAVGAFELRNLEMVLVDFAARVQFYTNNQWIVDQPQTGDTRDQGNRLKILLETVSNTVLVQADEMRRRAGHMEHQKDLLPNELAAAGNARYANVQPKAASTTRAGAPPAPVLSPDELAGLQTAVQARQVAARQSAALLALLQPPGTGAGPGSLKAEPLPAPARLAQLQRGLQQALAPAGISPTATATPAATHAGTTTQAELRQKLAGWVSATLAVDPDISLAVRQTRPEYQLLTQAAAAATRLPAADDAKPLARQAAATTLRQAVARLQEADAQAWRGAAAEYQALSAKAEAAKAAAATAEAQATTATTAGLAAAPAKVDRADRGSGAAGEASRPIDVEDAIIANLRHEQIEVIRSKGPDSTEAQNIGAALAQARRHRADMVYVRPSSTYLRSALPATFAQENPYVRWSNMLNDTVQNILRSHTEKTPLETTREDLDKVFWQNINRVRLNAAGSTNYVVAKDDVGNWYVKGMGSDPAAMVSAAKNLALFNLGGRLNSNLLRVDELRGRMASDTTAGPEQRKEWSDEIDRLSTGSDSGGAITERGQTLALFQANYDKATREHLQALKAMLAGDALKNQILQKWQATAADSLATLTPVLAQPALDGLLEQARTAAATTPADVTADLIISSLKALEGYRRALRAAVLAEPGLVSVPDAALKAAEQSLAQATQQAQQAQALVQASVAAGTASQAYQQAVIDYGQRLAQQESQRTALQKSQGELAGALQRRARLGADVDKVLRAAISEMVDKRLRAVQELETAANVVGRRGP